MPAVAGKPFFGYLAALLFIAASAFAIPAMVDWSLRFLDDPAARLWGRSHAGFAQPGFSLRRTSVLVGALSTAIAMMTSVGIMVGSFRQTVQSWMDRPAEGRSLLAACWRSCHRIAIPPLSATWRMASPSCRECSVSRFRGYEISTRDCPRRWASADTRRRTPFGRQSSPAAPAATYCGNAPRRRRNRQRAVRQQASRRTGDTITLPLGERTSASASSIFSTTTAARRATSSLTARCC